MITLSLPWWEFFVRAIVVYVALLAMVRFSGRRTVGQFTPFDLLVVMLLSEAVSNALSGGDESLAAGLLVAAILIGLNRLVAFASSRSARIAELVDGAPVLLGRDGRFFQSVVKRCRLAQADLDQALREADCKSADMASAVLEADGRITIQKKGQ
jgi:uncharacterized membrane protein YcaP (DUF421 family)